MITRRIRLQINEIKNCIANNKSLNNEQLMLLLRLPFHEKNDIIDLYCEMLHSRSKKIL